ncbi:MAG TPA: ATP-dependent 6-phosphofructokinase [Gemmatimonadales bacterium]|jgi:6-phosphofructokinase 1|nr:ATP-dependent 6-phosphofructokinase [Gemmatimonadales bacterium]
MRIAISTGGGDAPGLNAVIRAVVVAAVGRGWEVLGVGRGFGGLLGEDEIVALDRRSVRGLTSVGGTILGTTNRGNPFAWPVRAADGAVTTVDRSDEVMRAFRRHALDALVLVGGDGTLRIGYDFWQKGMPVIGVPKTIDNDVGGTVISFGFDTAVNTATDAIDKIHSTAASHDRVLVVEVMGRHAGWIALHSGLAGSAHAILIPEIPYDIERVCAAIRARESRGRHFSIVVVAEGAMPRGGTVTLRTSGGAGAAERLGGIAERVATEIAERTGKETRTVTLGHLQRGGSPTTFDRLLGLRFGAAAVRAVAAEAFGQMVVLQPPTIATAPLECAVAGPRTVPLDSDSLLTARELDVALGD